MKTIKNGIAIFFLLSGLLFPVSSVAQALYANEDNIITISVPGIAPSELVATAEGGTLVRKKGTDQWIARPSGEKEESGMRKDFVVTISTNINGKGEEVLASKVYRVTKTHTINYYDKATHYLKIDEFVKGDNLILKVEGIKEVGSIHFYMENYSRYVDMPFDRESLRQLSSYFSERLCHSLYMNQISQSSKTSACSVFFSRLLINEEELKKRPFAKVEIKRALNASGETIELSPIEITFE